MEKKVKVMLSELCGESERIEEFLQFNLRIIQDPSRFCFGIDAVLLSCFARMKKSDRVCDLGTGSGIIPLLMARRYTEPPVIPTSLVIPSEASANYVIPSEASAESRNLFPERCLDTSTKLRLARHDKRNSPIPPQFTALEIQSDSADMARRSVELNGLSDKIKIITGDIKNACSLLPKNTFDVVTSNPPYFACSDNGEKSIARHEILCTLEDVVKSAAGLLKSNGRFFMIHKPARLSEICVTLTKYKLEPKRVRLVFPFADKEPTMVLIESEKCAKKGMRIEPPLVVYKEKGVYTDEVKKIYGLL